MKLFSQEKGFTLLELLISFLLVSIVTSSITALTMWIINSQADSTARITADRQVENSILWLSRDIKQAQQVIPGASAGFPLQLVWKDWGSAGNNTQYLITYSLNGQDLMRQCTSSSNTTSTLVAGSVTSAVCEQGDNVFTVTLTVTSGVLHKITETRTIEVFPSARTD